MAADRPATGDEPLVCVVHAHDGRIHEIADLPYQLRDEISHFFDVYKDLGPRRSSEVNGFADRARALEEIEASRRRFEEHRGERPAAG